jgi:hypothetical protein
MKRIALIGLLVALLTRELSATDLPKPPAGLAWQEIPELKAAFLKPDGWFFKRESGKGTLAYFITKEDINKTGEFETGLTVNVFRLKQDSAVDRGKALIDQMSEKHHVMTQSRESGPFKEFTCEMTDTDATGTTMIHALTVANPKTNTLYLFIFESPAATWDVAWKLGQQIMDKLSIDDSI